MERLGSWPKVRLFHVRLQLAGALDSGPGLAPDLGLSLFQRHPSVPAVGSAAFEEVAAAAMPAGAREASVLEGKHVLVLQVTPRPQLLASWAVAAARDRVALAS